MTDVIRHFLRHKYDPSVADIQRIFPDYRLRNKDEFIAYYNEHRPSTGCTPASDAVFALKKLGQITTSYKLTLDQHEQLKDVSEDRSVNGLYGWNAFCTILHPRQIEYVGW